MKTLSIVLMFTVLGALLTGVGCDTFEDPQSSEGSVDPYEHELQTLLASRCPSAFAPPPSPLVTVAVGDRQVQFWPYTGADFSGTGQDPINLIFVGEADPRDIRSALMSLDGDRSAFGMPDMPPFNQRWQDAIGDVQAAFGTGEGWTGGAIQLACGDYEPLRFHIRLFRIGEWTIANAHLDMHIPGTADHEVLSWELAEQFVTADLIRSGLLDPGTPMLPTEEINQPNYRSTPWYIYNEIPIELRALIGGPLGDVSEDVPKPSDGHAMVFNLAGRIDAIPGEFEQVVPVVYGQTVPKPFCANGPLDYIYIAGPIDLRQITRIKSDGSYHVVFKAKGTLQVTPVNPLTGEPTGQTLTAHVSEQHTGLLDDTRCSAGSWIYQALLPENDPNAGSLFRRLRAGNVGRLEFEQTITCSESPGYAAE